MVKVSFEITDIPVDATNEEIEEWLRFCFNATGSMSAKNPLVDYEADADFNTFEVEFD